MANSTKGPNHPTFPSQDAWARARERYVEDLTEEEKCLYYQATPETLFYDASAAQKKYTAGSTTFAVAEKLQPLRDAIEQYGQAMDMYCNAYPLVISPLWGSIRILLRIAGEFSKYFEKLVDMFERIGDVLPRFRVYERLFSNHERLIQALSVAYVDIITFCSKCKTVFRQGQRHSKTTFKVAFKLTWKPFERQFSQVIDSLRNHRKSVEKEAGLSHMIEAADSRSLVVANQLQLEQQRRADAHRAILAAIPSVDTGAKHRKLRNLRYPGTGEWLLQDEVYNAWLIAKNSSYICCHGIPGCGKSVLASTVIDSLLEVEALKVVYFYCDYSDQRTLQIHRILGTILKQLFTAGRIPDEIEEQVIQTFVDVSTSPAPNELVSLVCLAINLNPAVAVVLDGLDECEQDVKDQMLAFLERLKTVGKPVIKLFISCREEDRILRTLTHYLRIRVTSTASKSDISSFVRGSVRSRIEAGKLRLRNAKLEQEIVSILAEKANGMFLWVFFQLEDLCHTHSDAEIHETLSDLPDGIFATYDRILSKIFKRRTRNVASKVFTWITSAQRPLTSAELQEAVAFDSSDKAWDETKIPHEDLMIESCNGLVVRNEIDSTVRLAHYTVHQYLFYGTTRDLTDHVNLFLLDNKGKYVGQMCITYLNFSDFETQITPQQPAQGLEATGILASGGPALIPSVLGVKRFIFDLAYRVSGGNPVRPTPVINWTEHLKTNTFRKHQLPTDFAKRYALLQYVIDYWVYHTKDLSGDDAYGKKLQDLAYNKNLPFEFRPWGANEHYGPYGCVSCSTVPESPSSALRYMSLFHYAAEAGHWLLMEPFIQQCCDHEVYTDITFLIACRHGQDTIVDRLLRTGRSFHKSTKKAVNIAATLGHARVLDRVLIGDKQNPPHELTSEWLTEPLFIAATNGLEEVVNLLCNAGADVNRRDKESGRTPLASASMNGHLEVVENLLKWNARIEDEDFVKHSAFYLAAEVGHSSVLRVLLQAATPPFETRVMDNKWGLSQLIEATTDKRCTALHKAAERGYDRDVEILVEYCADQAKRKPMEAISYSAPEIYSGGCAVMHLTAMRGHVGVLEFLSQGYFTVDARSPNGYTALHLAAGGGHESAVRWLVSHYAGIDLETSAGDTALHLATAAGHESVVRWLVTNQAGIDVKSSAGKTALHLAAAAGHESIVRWLAPYYVGINVKTSAGETALHLAAAAGHEPVVRWLVSHHAGIDIKSSAGETALHLAAAAGHESAVRWLVSDHAGIDVETSAGDTALHLATAAGHESVVRWLVTNQAGIDVKSSAGETALHLAAAAGHEPVVRWLVSHHAGIDVKSSAGETALHLAAAAGHEPVVRWLVTNQAGIDVKSSAGETALHLAAAAGHEPVVRWLVTNQAGIDVKSSAGETALHLAAAAGHESVVRWPVLNHADINAVRDVWSIHTPIKLAALQGRAEVVLALLDLGADSNGVLVESLKYGYYVKDQWLLRTLIEYPTLGQDRQELERALAYVTANSYEERTLRYSKAAELIQSALTRLGVREEWHRRLQARSDAPQRDLS